MTIYESLQLFFSMSISFLWPTLIAIIIFNFLKKKNIFLPSHRKWTDIWTLRFDASSKIPNHRLLNIFLVRSLMTLSITLDFKKFKN